MTKINESRVAKLEAKRPTVEGSVAVVRWPQSANDGWADAMVAELGWSDRRACVWVVDGPCEILLPITPADDLRGEREAVWLEAGRTYPHSLITFGEEGLVSYRIVNEADEAVLLAQLEKELAA